MAGEEFLQPPTTTSVLLSGDPRTMSDQQIADVVGLVIWDAMQHMHPFARALAEDTDVGVEGKPTRRELQLAGNPRPNQVLLGLFTAGGGQRPRISVYGDSIRRVGADPREVALHELAHRLGYDHKVDEVVQSLFYAGCTGEQPIAADTAAAAASGYQPVVANPGYVPRNDNCPMCLFHARLAEAMALTEGLWEDTNAEGRIPPGLGGTVPLIHHRVDEARALLQLVGRMVRQPAEVAAVAQQLDVLEQMTAGFVGADQVNVLRPIMRQTWKRGYELVRAYYVQSRG